MNGRNGNILEGYYGNRNKPNWSTICALITVIVLLLGILYQTLESKVDLKLKNAALENEIVNLKYRNEVQKQILENRYAPNNSPPP